MSVLWLRYFIMIRSSIESIKSIACNIYLHKQRKKRGAAVCNSFSLEEEEKKFICHEQ